MSTAPRDRPGVGRTLGTPRRSGTLVRAMLADGLVDELHLFVFPLTLGEGQRLFPEGGAPTKLKLAGTEAYNSEVVHLSYAATQ